MHLRKWILITMLCLSPISIFGTDNSWDALINAIIYVESRGNVNAINGSCVGPMQISPGLVTECNNILKKKKSEKRFTLADRKSVEKSIEMFNIIQDKFNPERNLEKAARIWNAGPYSKPSAARGYVKLVINKYNNLIKK